MAASTPTTLAGHLAATPDQPWLFYPHAHGWKWLSYAQGARRVGALRRLLEELPAQGRVGFPARCGGQAVLSDLAVRLSGRTAVPIPWQGTEETGRQLERLDGCGWLVAPDREEVAGAVVTLRAGALQLDQPVAEVDAAPLDAPLDAALAEPLVAGGVWVRGNSPDGPGNLLSAAQLAEEASRLRRAMGEKMNSPRAITVLSEPLDNALACHLLAWAGHSGAALVLEPNPEAYPASVAWVRPTVVLAADGAQASLLHRRAQASVAGRHWRRHRPPWGRLRFLLLPPDLALPEAEREFWEAHQVRVIGLGN